MPPTKLTGWCIQTAYVLDHTELLNLPSTSRLMEDTKSISIVCRLTHLVMTKINQFKLLCRNISAFQLIFVNLIKTFSSKFCRSLQHVNTYQYCINRSVLLSSNKAGTILFTITISKRDIITFIFSRQTRRENMQARKNRNHQVCVFVI